MADPSIENLKRTVYRYIYAGWLKSRKVNAISLEAELCLIRLNLIADGSGNFHADPELVAIEAFPLRRSVTPEDCQQWIDELADHGLVSLYEAVGEKYGHIVNFTEIQPAGKNGKRHELHPTPPGFASCDDSEQGEPAGPKESRCIQIDPDNPSESRLIRVDPVYPGGQNENENEKKNENENENEKKKENENDSGDFSEPNSRSGSPTDERLTREKGKVRWVGLIAQSRMIGRDNGATHPVGSKQYSADMTSVDRLWDRVWPEEVEFADADQAGRFNELMKITKGAKGKRKPMAWMTSQIKQNIAEIDV